MNVKQRQHFDYIVVGGGTAGSVVAARLAERPDLAICLIEAGPTDEGKPDILAVKNWPHLLGTELDYDYSIEPQVRGNSRIRHSRGRVLGGCSSHNSCIAFRAPDEDMDAWHQLGCAGWSASDTHPYFEKVLEKVALDTNPPLNPLSQAFLTAAQQAGFPLTLFKMIWEANQPVPEETTQYWEVGLFAKSVPASPLPDLMLHFGVVPFDWHTVPSGYPTAAYGFSMTPNVTRAKSEGIVQLRSARPDDPPLIDCRYFTDPEDYDETLLITGLKLARTIAEQPALKHWIKRELAPGSAVQSDRDLSEYARRTANTVYHPAGTCRMGDRCDSLTVVDSQLRVKGVHRLRVADASIFPCMITVNPCLTCMMIGEKCADLLKQV